VADTNPAQAAPSAAPQAGGYLVQVSSQRNEADAQASYKSLQGKFPAVLGSHSPVIKRADLGEKGVYYRAMVGPFGTPDEATQFCGSLKSAGGQCVIQRN
jgi:cell division septation protein DedD